MYSFTHSTQLLIIYYNWGIKLLKSLHNKRTQLVQRRVRWGSQATRDGRKCSQRWDPELKVGICPINNYGKRMRLQETESVPQILSAHVGNNPDLIRIEISTEVILKRKLCSSYKTMLIR